MSPAADRPEPTPSSPPASTRPTPPPEVVVLAEERAEARARHDWDRADALKAAIETAGWKVVDAGRRWSLFPASPPDAVIDGVIRYGSAHNVPSVLGEPADAAASVIVVARSDPGPADRLLAGLRAHAPAGVQAVVVVNDAAMTWDDRGDPVAGVVAADGWTLEVVRTSETLGAAAAWNVGLRRARGAVVVLSDASVEPIGDAVSPTIDAFRDEDVAVVGAFGLSGPRLPHLAATSSSEPDVIDAAWLAFRREDYLRLGPMDERFVAAAFLDAWWSLTLRAGDDAAGGDAAGDGPAAAPRRAVRLDLPLVRRSASPTNAAAARDEAGDPGTARLARRNGYRLLARFGDRPDLLGAEGDGAPGGSRA